MDRQTLRDWVQSFKAQVRSASWTTGRRVSCRCWTDAENKEDASDMTPRREPSGHVDFVAAILSRLQSRGPT
jgi:hypothetical protein